LNDKLQIYFTRDYSNISVTNDGVTRQTSGEKMASIINQMDNEDRDLLVRFAQAIIEAATGNISRLRDW
jgi:hypothetical protein